LVKLDLFLDYEQKQFTGKVVSSLFVQKLCGDINSDGNEKEELYIQLKVANSGEMIKTDIKLFEEEKTKILEISNATQELTIGEELCKTRAKPIDEVYVDTFNRIEDLPNKNKYVPINIFEKPTEYDYDEYEKPTKIPPPSPLYIKYGYYLIKVKFSFEDKMDNFVGFQSSIEDVQSIIKRLKKDKIYTINIKETKEPARTYKKKTDVSKVEVGDEIYFFKKQGESSKDPIEGKITKVSPPSWFRKNTVYTVQYKENGHDVNTEVSDSDVYQMVTTGGKTKRSKIRKSIKKKQSMKKSGFSRRSIKKKHRRSRKQR
jgi:hypothetical protein